MAKGYPTRPPEPDPLARFELPAPDVCIICKRRPAAQGGICDSCDAALSGR